MTKLSTLTNNKHINNALDYIANISEHIPFGNSEFQNVSTIVNWEISPHRALRHSLLRIQNKLNALNECYYWQKENEIKIERLERKNKRLEKEKTEDYDLDVRDNNNEIEKINSNKSSTDKLIKDAICEINTLAPIVHKIGKLSKDEFEKFEKQHFIRKLRLKPNEKWLVDISLLDKETLSLVEWYEWNLYKDIIKKWKNILKLN